MIIVYSDAANCHSYEGFVESIGRMAVQIISWMPMGRQCKTVELKLAAFIDLWELGDEGKRVLHREERKRFQKDRLKNTHLDRC